MRLRGLGVRIPVPLMLVALVLGGCGSGGDPTATASPAVSGTPWIVVAPGRATTAPASGAATGTRSPFPSGFLPLPSGGAATATPSPTPVCALKPRGTINSAGVTTASTSAAVTFYNPGGNDLVQFRVTAISQNLKLGPQRDVGWTVITPSATCGFMTATVTGLDPRSSYVFSVDAVYSRQDRDSTRAETIARSRPVFTK